MQKKSAASLRASTYPNRDDEWLCVFHYTEAPGLGYEVGVHRRDPSSIIEVEGKYYVYYTKSTGPACNYAKDERWKKYPWDHADIWCAVSVNGGASWNEIGCAVERGVEGTYDSRTVCTPDVLAHEGKYYLVYQCVGTNDKYTGGNERVGMSVASSPEGPWTRLEQPIQEKADNDVYFEDKDSYNTGEFYGNVHDPFLLFSEGKFLLYYKCCSRVGTKYKWKKGYAGRDTRWGVSISDNPEGPYVASEFNPITNSGHETLLWNYRGGVAALINRDGPEANTVQYAKDGINFEIMATTQFTPQAGGPFVPANIDEHPLNGLKWGLCHCDEKAGKWNYIFRYDTFPSQADIYPMNYPPHLFK